MTIELIKVTTGEEGKRLVSARELHEFLEVKTKYVDWFNRMREYGFEENIDFILALEKRKTNNPKNPYTEIKDHAMSIDMAKDLCRKQRRNNKAPLLLEYLLSLEGKEILYIEPKRPEYQFSDMLDKITGFEWDKQYPIDGGKYRLDFKLGNTLIVEYDENHHKYQEKEDNERIEYCIKWLANESENEIYGEYYEIPVIRVKEGFEIEGIREVMDFLIADEAITNYNGKCVRSRII